MRRGFSILLILVFGLGPLSATLQASDDASLPACCRRNGAHHCAMAVQMAAMMRHMPPDSRPAFTVPPTCPYYPGARPLLITAVHALAANASPVPGLRVCSFAPAAGRALTLSSPSRNHPGRGPPTPLAS
jgi:hypothetical protein